MAYYFRDTVSTRMLQLFDRC